MNGYHQRLRFPVLSPFFLIFGIISATIVFVFLQKQMKIELTVTLFVLAAPVAVLFLMPNQWWRRQAIFEEIVLPLVVFSPAVFPVFLLVLGLHLGFPIWLSAVFGAIGYVIIGIIFSGTYQNNIVFGGTWFHRLFRVWRRRFRQDEVVFCPQCCFGIKGLFFYQIEFCENCKTDLKQFHALWTWE